MYARDYVELYVDTVRDEALKNDDTRDFLTSSPTNGIESEKEGFVAENPYSWFYGDGNDFADENKQTNFGFFKCTSIITF